MKRILCALLFFVFLVSPSHAQENIPDFTLTNLEGNQTSLSDYLGKENLLLVFGATWCPPCNVEIPVLNKLHADFGGEKLKILVVDIGESEKTVRKHMKKKGVEYEVVLDESGDVAGAFGVYGIPANFYFGKDGQNLRIGHLTYKRVKALVES